MEINRSYVALNELLVRRDFQDSATAAIEALDRITQAKEDSAEAAATRAQALARQSRDLTVLALALGAVLGAALAWLIGRSIAVPTRQLQLHLDAITAGRLDAAVPHVDDGNEIGALARSAALLQAGARELADERWVKTHVGELGALLQSAVSSTEVAQRFLGYVAPLLEIGQGLVLRFDEGSQKLHLLQGYALPAQDRPALALGEGLAGQCAQERRSVLVNSPPAGYLHISSGLGEAAPHTLLLHPILRNERLLGVIELAGFSPFSTRGQALLQAALPLLAMSLEIMERSERTQALLARSQRQAQELEAQRAAISATEVWYRGIVESAPDGMLVADDDGRIVMANAQLEIMFGYAPGQLTGMPIETLVPGVVREGHQALRRGFMEAGGKRSMAAGNGGELHGLRRDGSEFPIDVGLSRLPALGEHGVCVCASVRDVSERLTAQREIERARQFMETVLENFDSAVFVKDREGRYTFVNNDWVRATGVPREQAIGRTSLEIEQLGASGAADHAADLAVMAAGQVQTEEGWTAPVLGERHYQLTKVPMRENGVVTGLCSVAVDITKRFEAERLLRKLLQQVEQSKKLNQAILDNSPAVIYLKDLEGRYLFVNRAWCEIFKHRPEEVVGRHPQDLFDTSRAEAYIQADLSALAAGSIQHSEDSVDAEGARRRYASVRIPLRDAEGAIYALCVIATDMTERLEAEQALAESAERLNFALRGGNLGLWDWDVATGHSRINEIWADMLGYRQEELVDGQGSAAAAWERLLHPEDTAAAHQAFSHCIEDPRSQEYQAQFRLRHKSGEWRWILSQGRAIERDANGRAVRLVGIHQDISERMQLQEEMARAKASAEAATQAKSEFLANMSHEIRTPMNAIIGMSHLALQTSLDKRQRNYIEKVHRAAENLLGIINDILDFSKIEAGKLVLERIDFRLEDVMDNLANLVGMKAEDKGLELLFETAPELPTALVGDPLRLGQVLINLGNNAVKFTEQGEIVVGAEVVHRGGSDVELHFWVRDTGIGMDASQCARLFQSFSQADASTTRKYGGTGLGLAISKNLVEAMEGRIWVESQPGQGSRFHFHARFGVQASPAPRRQFQHEAFRGKRVLVVDDNATAREIMGSMAKGCGLEVDVAADGHEALRMAAAQALGELPYDLVLMDWKMPMMDGIEAVQRLYAQLQRAMPAVIMVTAFGREEAQSAAERRGVPLRTVLTKPVTPAALVDALGEIFDAGNAAAGGGLATVQRAGEAAAAHLRGARVLLVEDNEMNQELATELLQEAGLEVVLAENGQAALELLQRDCRFDAVLMDCQMPVMDGYQATRAIRANPAWQHLPVVAMTANAMAGDRAKVLAAGMVGHIAKPLRLEEMFETLAKWVRPTGAAPATAPAAPVSEVAEALPKIPGLDLSAGLLTMHGNRALYRRMLLRFLQSQGPFAEEFEAARDDAAAATRAAHTLKGLAGNIGATRLQKAAGELEQACEQERGREAIDFALRSTLAALFPLLEGLQAYAESESKVASPSPAAAAAGGAAEGWKADLPRLRRLLDELDQEAVELVERLVAAAAGTPAEPALRRAAAAAENFDFDGARAALELL